MKASFGAVERVRPRAKVFEETRRAHNRREYPLKEFAILRNAVNVRGDADKFALGIESLERFNRREPLRRTHECVFGVLALESEPVDPRL